MFLHKNGPKRPTHAIITKTPSKHLRRHPRPIQRFHQHDINHRGSKPTKLSLLRRLCRSREEILIMLLLINGL